MLSGKTVIEISQETTQLCYPQKTLKEKKPVIINYNDYKKLQKLTLIGKLR